MTITSAIEQTVSEKLQRAMAIDLSVPASTHCTSAPARNGPPTTPT